MAQHAVAMAHGMQILDSPVFDALLDAGCFKRHGQRRPRLQGLPFLIPFLQVVLFAPTPVTLLQQKVRDLRRPYIARPRVESP